MKYQLDFTIKFKKQHRKLKRQNKDLNKLYIVINNLLNGEELPAKYNNHKLTDNKKYSECFECHIEPDWLLIYKVKKDKVVLLLVETGSHSELFSK